MTDKTLIAALCGVLLAAALAPAPVAAQNSTNTTDGGPSIVEDVTPDFLSDLFSSLPVPDFVKGLFGADTTGDSTNSTNTTDGS